MKNARLNFLIFIYLQGRREPRVGPGTTQILRISGFVQSKTSKENGTLFHGFSSDLKKKKKVFTKIETFFLSKFRWSQKKGLWCFTSMGPVKPIGSLVGPLNSMGPEVIVPPCPPLGGPVFVSLRASSTIVVKTWALECILLYFARNTTLPAQKLPVVKNINLHKLIILCPA